MDIAHINLLHIKVESKSLEYVLDSIRTLWYSQIVTDSNKNVNNKFCRLEVLDVANLDIREAAVSSRVKLWQVADVLGIADSNLSRKLRKELPQDEKERIFSIIKQLAKEAG